MSYSEYLAKAKTAQLSTHFTLYDVANSLTAKNDNIENIPSPQVVQNAGLLIKNVLEPLIARYKTKPDISSFYRCPELNQKVGGVPNSQHTTGKAVDITIVGVPLQDLFNYIKVNIPFDQLIIEGVNNFHWVHVSYSSTLNRKQVLSYNGEEYKTA